MAKYLTTPKQWDRLVVICREKGVIGVDTEFYGLDPSKQSCVGRARIHVWSIAVRTGELDARGYTDCVGWMLPAAALLYPPLIALLEDKDVKKELHNEAVDKHAFRNHGIKLKGARDTLSYVKWMMPHLINLPGRFKLKNLMNVMLHRDPVCSFKELVSDVRVVQNPYQVKRKSKGCSCGLPKCKKRKAEATPNAKGELIFEFHEKKTTEYFETRYREKNEKFKWSLPEIIPGHPRFELLTDYAIEDAIAALQVAEIAAEQKDPAPWPYALPAYARSKCSLCGAKAGTVCVGLCAGTGTRPGYSQPLTEAIIAMESTGIPRDKPFCTEQAKTAEEDEAQVLNWLYKWYVVNSDTYGPHGRNLRTRKTATGKLSVISGTDGIWSSTPKKQKLFAALGFPESPVWAKGKVKKGKVKLDHVAMKWISDNHPPAKQIVAKLLLLGRIRNGKKYLVKLRDADDIVYPICGAAGDDDDRSGAVTGRLGIKGEIEAMQLPKPGEKDLYSVRRAIVAQPVS